MQETTSSINPLAFSSLRQLDVDQFEDDLALQLQKKKLSTERDKVSSQNKVYFNIYIFLSHISLFFE